MNYDKIEKIEGRVYQPSLDLTLKHVTKLAFKDPKTNKRKYFQTTISYPVMSSSNSYVDRVSLEKMTLMFKSYLILEKKGSDWKDKVTVQIDDKYLPKVKRHFRKMCDMMEADENRDMFYIENRQLHFNKEFSHVKQLIQLKLNQTILLTPTVVIDYDGVSYEGVRIYLNTTNTFSDIPIDDFYALTEKFEQVDLYLYGLAMVNYIGRKQDDSNDRIDMRTSMDRHDEMIFDRMNSSHGVSQMNESFKGYFR